MKLLVTGGAGYVGSVVVSHLVAAGHAVTVLDDLSTGHADAVPAGAALVVATLRTGAAALLADGSFDAVLHFAAKSVTGESVARPGHYWDQNLGESLALFDAMRQSGVRRIVFSSTAATYGDPEHTPIRETDPTRPVSPYGATKLAIDTVLASYAELHGFGAVSLRYFNVAGAHAGLGERHEPETHLIANVLAVPMGRGGEVSLFGSDYPTPDGTCVRDYIHVADLAAAHLLALDACEPGRHRIYNLGSGSGHSVKEVIDMCRQVTGHRIPVALRPRRQGDPAVLVASSEKILRELGWRAERDLAAMVHDAWTYARRTS
ncbi:UDP-glucose 4-epimerase GalE [Streptomyces sulfonofaciens]|uniref:UDP-glucose 4-epimerase n=1 Tax=Streptomyces sulfonofaciens TaxID=68272 RepID=A0A919GKP8_9ACTN|nr:UDP-glucose 4-epimerase GalE [Streptomyces sulfonofaciens]GHH86449.1 UDP-glucose 4-epimerase GalE [Streptomyces sulfonofaciens]